MDLIYWFINIKDFHLKPHILYCIESGPGRPGYSFIISLARQQGIEMAV